MSVLTSGRKEPCKDNIGGISEIWLTSFVPYSAKIIEGYREMLITSFPTTLMFKYEGQGKSLSESINEDRSYSQEVTIRLAKQDLFTAGLLDTLLKKKVRAIVIDRLGGERVAGLHNGLDAELIVTSGGNRSDYNGYDLKLEGLEPFSAPYLASFPGSGFEKEGVVLDCLLASSDKPASLGDKVSSCNIAA